jgi:hypothetical protein
MNVDFLFCIIKKLIYTIIQYILVYYKLHQLK